MDPHDMLRRLNLSHISATFAETVLQAAQANLSHEAFLYKFAAPECAVSPTATCSKIELSFTSSFVRTYLAI